jgi:hypothetical protein
MPAPQGPVRGRPRYINAKYAMTTPTGSIAPRWPDAIVRINPVSPANIRLVGSIAIRSARRIAPAPDGGGGGRRETGGADGKRLSLKAFSWDYWATPAACASLCENRQRDGGSPT